MRLFVALDIPDAVRRALRELMARLKSECAGARGVRPEGRQITLKFLGETDEPKPDSIRAALSTIHSGQTIESNFRGIGFFPNEFHPRVVWCGIESSSNLPQLASGVDSALQPFGFPAEPPPSSLIARSRVSIRIKVSARLSARLIISSLMISARPARPSFISIAVS